MSEKDYQEILQDFPRRRKIWAAIAELSFDRPWIDVVVRSCRESGYSWDELDHIAHYEVAAALWFNWAYFSSGFWPLLEPFIDGDWLAERILKKVRRRHHALRVKLLGHCMMSVMNEKWREVERRFKSGGDGDGDDKES